MESQLIEKFNFNGRICAVVRLFSEGIGEWHNGYVQTKDNKQYDYDDNISDIETDELTFSGFLNYDELKGIHLLGFDSAHYWNEQDPQSKTFDSVKLRTEQLASEMVSKGI